jgi:hypothetical protein
MDSVILDRSTPGLHTRIFGVDMAPTPPLPEHIYGQAKQLGSVLDMR